MDYYSYYKDDIVLAADEKGLKALYFKDDNLISGQYRDDLDIFIKTKKWLDAYFSGHKDKFPCRLSLNGSNLDLKVWEALSTIEYGKTLSYEKVANMVASKPRATANAIGRNKLLIIIPCHRVIRKDGSLGGYRGGIENKKKLIELEKRYRDIDE